MAAIFLPIDKGGDVNKMVDAYKALEPQLPPRQRLIFEELEGCALYYSDLECADALQSVGALSTITIPFSSLVVRDHSHHKTPLFPVQFLELCCVGVRQGPE